jgi:hypothetical protein
MRHDTSAPRPLKITPPPPAHQPLCRMYSQKHGANRPAELIRTHLERLEKERAMAEAERRAAIAAAGEGEGGEEVRGAGVCRF